MRPRRQQRQPQDRHAHVSAWVQQQGCKTGQHVLCSWMVHAPLQQAWHGGRPVLWGHTRHACAHPHMHPCIHAHVHTHEHIRMHTNECLHMPARCARAPCTHSCTPTCHDNFAGGDKVRARVLSQLLAVRHVAGEVSNDKHLRRQGGQRSQAPRRQWIDAAQGCSIGSAAHRAEAQRGGQQRMKHGV